MNNHIYQTNYGPLIVLETMGHKARGRFVETNYERTFWLKDLKTGRVRDLYYRSVLDVGYLGEGPYSHLLTHKVYHDWYDMFRRCYDLKFKAKNKTYKECYVDDSFHCLQDFGLWYDKQRAPEDWCVDKDLLVRNNKVYGAETCCRLPVELNTCINRQTSKRTEICIGVYDINGNIYSRFNVLGLSKAFGYRCDESISNAFHYYKKHKEAYIKKLAKHYKSELKKRVYDALMTYEVRQDD